MKANEYFTFSRRERNGIVALVILLLLVILLARMKRASTIAKAVTIDSVVYADTAIKNKGDHYSDTARQFGPHFKNTPFNKKFKPRLQPVEINTADTSALIALPGIGSKLAERIVLFREKLGGFYDVQQVSEVYGLRDSVFRKLKPLLLCEPGRIKKINVNAAAKEELQLHPYIRWKVANALVTYRQEHGSFSCMADLHRIESIDQATITKMTPYITFK